MLKTRMRLCRGGAFISNVRFLRSSAKDCEVTGWKSQFIGLRIFEMKG